MVKVLVGNLFESKAQTLVNTVNTVGVMGKGIALEFRKRFPEMYEDYRARCEAKQVHLGQPYLYKTLFPPWILNFPTKDHWRSVSRIDDIVRGLVYLRENYSKWGILSLAVPPLGAGQGQLEWRVVGKTLYRYLSELDIPVELYAPFEAPLSEIQSSFFVEPKVQEESPSKVEPGWIAVVEILKAIENEPYHRNIGRVTFQKIVYFATSCGIQTGLRFRRGSYGPFAEELKRQITILVNNGLIKEQRMGRMFKIETGPTFNDARWHYADQMRKWSDSIEKIADLFLRMDTNQAEIAATVHYATSELLSARKQITEQVVLESVMQWKQKHRPPIDESSVSQTIRNLNLLNWLGPKVEADLPLSEEQFLEV